MASGCRRRSKSLASVRISASPKKQVMVAEQSANQTVITAGGKAKAKLQTAKANARMTEQTVLAEMSAYSNISKALKFGETTSRTMAIETAMKSSAFGFLLAKLHFGNAAVRVPSAVSVVWMALTGSSMAVAWRFMPVKPVKFDRSVKERFESVDLLTRAKEMFGKIRCAPMRI